MLSNRQHECPHCNGTGQVLVMEDQRDGVPVAKKPVSMDLKTRRCGWCGGLGVIDTTDHPEEHPDHYEKWCDGHRPDASDEKVGHEPHGRSGGR